MYKEPSSNSSSGNSSRKGDEVELVCRFLAPLCARDEAARNAALAAARTTVEGWLGGVGSPNNNWEIAPVDLEDKSATASAPMGVRIVQCQKSSPLRVTPVVNANANYRMQLRDGLYASEGFFPQSVSEGAATIFTRKTSFDANLTPERYPSGSFDCVDGKTNDFEYNGTPSHNRSLLKEAESRFGSSSDSERRFFASNEGLNESYGSQDEKQQRSRHYMRIKSGRQKQFDEDDELDADTRVYGKSPKFDDTFGNLEFLRTSRNRQRSEDHELEAATPPGGDSVVFNTLDGFLNSAGGGSSNSSPPKDVASGDKRPLSCDEDAPWKSGKVLESPEVEVTPGDVGRMLNLGNALDGPRQAQANKYLSLVSLHLPVILRLSINCPFQNVRIKCAEIIQMIKVISMLVGVRECVHVCMCEMREGRLRHESDPLYAI